MGLIVLCGIGSTLLTLRLRAGMAVAAVIGLTLAYCTAAMYAFLWWRWWIPIVQPLGVSFILTHVALIASLARTEQRARHQTMEIFSKLVSPVVARELVRSEKLGLQGARRQDTGVFADVRNFPEISY